MASLLPLCVPVDVYGNPCKSDEYQYEEKQSYHFRNNAVFDSFVAHAHESIKNSENKSKHDGCSQKA